MDNVAPCSRCWRAVGASLAVLAWCAVTALSVFVPAAVVGLAPVVVAVGGPLLAVAAGIALLIVLASTYEEVLPGHGACALGSVASVVGAGAVAGTLTLIWLGVLLVS